MRLKRSLKIVPVIDSDGKHLYEVDRETAADHLSAGRALNVEGRAIRFISQSVKVACGSAEAIPRWVSEGLGARMARGLSVE